MLYVHLFLIVWPEREALRKTLQMDFRKNCLLTDKKQEPALRAYKHKMTEMGVGRSAKVMKLGKDEELEAALFLWFKQKREEGIPITGPIVQAKA